MKIWKATFELFLSANHEEEIIVKANTERKAIIFAKEKAEKQWEKGSPRFIRIKEITNE